jgi:hypothetical protein
MLLKGDDVVHSGRATCKCIVYVHNWLPETQSVLEYLNEMTNNYLLIVPQDAFSLLADIAEKGQRISFRHFSNALVVVEKQWPYSADQFQILAKAGQVRADHSSGKGASHFSQLCNRANILFIGGVFDSDPLFALPGGMAFRKNIDITFWNTAVEVVVDVAKKEGYVYVSKQAKKNIYSLGQLLDWSNALRSIANDLGASGNQEMANHFYAVHYAIAPDSSPLDFDPFKLDETVIADFGGMEGFIESLKVVIEKGDLCAGDEAWDEDLTSYLSDLLSRLAQ